jgi:hypothetical protein
MQHKTGTPARKASATMGRAEVTQPGDDVAACTSNHLLRKLKGLRTAE